MYLEHFGLSEPPFSLTPNTGFFVDLPGHQEALNVLLVALGSGEGFIKITGEVGTGKTLLCRRLLEMLGDDFVTAYLPNPLLNPRQLHQALLAELGETAPRGTALPDLLGRLNSRLMELQLAGRTVVVLIDEAQAAPTETLEALRLLSNLETTRRKLLQIVLFGQPELDARLQRPELRQLRQRITFSYCLAPLQRGEVGDYIRRRLQLAGAPTALFTPAALALVHRASDGIPRLVNILCHKGLLAAYGHGDRQVGRGRVREAVADTEDAADRLRAPFWPWFASGLVLLLILLGAYIRQGALA
ncbi:MAG: AAA family ATPase [Desulfuromonadales bacterium]|nr:AAA family ATPase [Desulfuromonadales bacterium]